NAPDHVILHLAALAVDMDEAPKNAEQFDAFLRGQVTLEVGGEAVIVDGFAARLTAGLDQRGETGAIEIVALAEEAADMLPLLLGNASVSFHYLETQGRKGDPRVIRRKFRARLLRSEILEEGLYTFQHGLLAQNSRSRFGSRTAF